MNTKPPRHLSQEARALFDRVKRLAVAYLGTGAEVLCHRPDKNGRWVARVSVEKTEKVRDWRGNESERQTESLCIGPLWGNTAHEALQELDGVVTLRVVKSLDALTVQRLDLEQRHTALLAALTGSSRLASLARGLSKLEYA